MQSMPLDLAMESTGVDLREICSAWPLFTKNFMSISGQPKLSMMKQLLCPSARFTIQDYPDDVLPSSLSGDFLSSRNPFFSCTTSFSTPNFSSVTLMA